MDGLGWIAVGFQLLGFATLVFKSEVEPLAGKVIFDGGISAGSILLIFLLFILARVFRQGAAMREDLEGTV